MKIDREFELLIVGSSGVGKSSLLNRYVYGAYSESPIKEFFFSGIKFIKMQGEIVKLTIRDLVCRPDRIDLAKGYCRESHGVIVVYDITDQDSFTQAKDWLQQVGAIASDNVSKVLVANKIDLLEQRVVDTAAVQKFAEMMEVPLVETSARDSLRVNEVFESISQNAKLRWTVSRPTTYFQSLSIELEEISAEYERRLTAYNEKMKASAQNARLEASSGTELDKDRKELQHMTTAIRKLSDEIENSEMSNE